MANVHYGDCGEVRGKAQENLACYVIMDARERLGNPNAAELLWTTSAESYVEGGCEMHVHFRAGTVEGRILGDWCAVFNREREWLDFVGSNTVGNKIADRSQGEQDDMRQLVLVQYGKLVELPKGVIPELIPSVVRLQPFDFCLRGWVNPPKPLVEFCRGIGALFAEDRESRVTSYFTGHARTHVGGGKLKREVVEGGAEVVQAVPDDEAKMSWRLVEDFDPKELASAIGIGFGPRSVRAFFKPGVPFRFKAVQVIERSVQSPLIVEGHDKQKYAKRRVPSGSEVEAVEC